MVKNKVKVAKGNSHVPDEIVYDILRRVHDTKSLLRFRCVSKLFCSFIEGSLNQLIVYVVDDVNPKPRTSETTFISTNFDPQKLTDGNNKIADFSLFNYLNEPCFDKFLHMDCFNGLVCLCNDDDEVVICNPYTKHVFLPKTTTTKIKTHCWLAFDPKTKKHKVLKLHTTSYFEPPNWYIFTLGVDKSWREIRYDSTTYALMSRGVCVNGVIYCKGLFKSHIGAFDVGEEKDLGRIPFPVGVKWHGFSPALTEIKGELTLLDFKTCTDDGKIHIYTLINIKTDDQPAQWLKKQTIQIEVPLTVPYFTQVKSTYQGDIVMVPSFSHPKFVGMMLPYFLFYDSRKNECRKFELCGLGKRNCQRVCFNIWFNLAVNTQHLEYH